MLEIQGDGALVGSVYQNERRTVEKKKQNMKVRGISVEDERYIYIRTSNFALCPCN